MIEKMKFLSTVSYTHLDVYKRQVPSMADLMPSLMTTSILRIADNMMWSGSMRHWFTSAPMALKAVSYTHLRVQNPQVVAEEDMVEHDEVFGEISGYDEPKDRN